MLLVKAFIGWWVAVWALLAADAMGTGLAWHGVGTVCGNFRIHMCVSLATVTPRKIGYRPDSGGSCGMYGSNVFSAEEASSMIGV